jgi:hypothetical protein
MRFPPLKPSSGPPSTILWQVPPASTQTLPRHITWHPQLQQLMHSPVEEQALLRTAVGRGKVPF